MAILRPCNDLSSISRMDYRCCKCRILRRKKEKWERETDSNGATCRASRELLSCTIRRWTPRITYIRRFIRKKLGETFDTHNDCWWSELRRRRRRRRQLSLGWLFLSFRGPKRILCIAATSYMAPFARRSARSIPDAPNCKNVGPCSRDSNEAIDQLASQPAELRACLGSAWEQPFHLPSWLSCSELSFHVTADERSLDCI